MVTSTITYTSGYYNSPMPEAKITQKRNRLRQYGNNVYLSNNDEFEIELFNPLSSSVKAIIQMNGQKISNAGIVIHPGQRIYLERFIDTNNKFKFSVYSVDKNDPAAKRAIASNGDIVVEFYDEIQNSVYHAKITINNTNDYTSNYINFPYRDDWRYGSHFTDSPSLDQFMTCCIQSNNTLGIADSVMPELKETGRVTQGGKSDQVFSESNQQFFYVPLHTVCIKINPESERPIESKDLRQYCSSCGTRIKKSSWKFCPSCGNKIE